MKLRGLIIAAAVLAVLLGVLRWSNRHMPEENALATPSPSEAPPKILTLNEGDINKLELKKKSGEIVLTKGSDNKWQITAPGTLAVDQSAVSGMLTSVSSLNSERLVDEKALNLAQYGLAAPALEVAVTDKSNSQHKLLIGDDTPTGNAAYAKLDGDARVFTIASFTKSELDKSLNDLRDKRLLTVDANKISRLELAVKQQNLEFGRDKDQWQIVKPRPVRADGTKIDELVRKLTEARMEVGADTDDAKTAAAFAAGSPIATAKVTTDAGVQQLEVRKDKDDYYAKSSVVDGVFKVASDLGQALDKKLDDFRNKKLFDFGVNDPAKIEIRDGTKTYFLTKGGDDWWNSEGKKFEKVGAEALLNDLRDLQATDFAESGFTSTALEITVTPAEGKTVEKVFLSKGSKNTIAKREGDQTLYLLDANAIETLQKLAGDLKTEPASAK